MRIILLKIESQDCRSGEWVTYNVPQFNCNEVWSVQAQIIGQTAERYNKHALYLCKKADYSGSTLYKIKFEWINWDRDESNQIWFI